MREEDLSLSNAYRPKSQCGCRNAIAAAALFAVSLAAARPAFAATGQIPGAHAYDLLSEKADAISTESRSRGWAYVISGAAAVAISIPAFYTSEDVFAKAVYSVGQTLGVAAVGYGSYLVLVEDDYTRFKRIIDGSRDLSAAQKDRLSASFLVENAERARNVRKIRVITHTLTAALNFSNAITASDSELRTALYFIGGVNVLAAVSFTISKSEEENLAGALDSPRVSLIPSGMALSFNF